MSEAASQPQPARGSPAAPDVAPLPPEARALPAVELRYPKRHTRDRTRLLRKMERRMPRKEGEEAPPDWLENVERQRGGLEHCPPRGPSIPPHAQSGCPRCA